MRDTIETKEKRLRIEYEENLDTYVQLKRMIDMSHSDILSADYQAHLSIVIDRQKEIDSELNRIWSRAVVKV